MSFHHDKPNFEADFDISPISTRLRGAMRATIYEEGQKGPQEHIDVSNDWWVDVEWCLEGHLRHHLCGSFCIGVHLESIGKGKDYSFHEDDIEMEPCGNGYYRFPFRIPAGEIRTSDCGRLYLVAVTLTSKNPCGGQGHINAYVKEGCVMFHLPPSP